VPSNVSKRSVPVSPPAWRDSGVIFGWSEVPEPVPPTEHGYKYSAVYVVNGVRVVGFDNERGKGELSVRELARTVGRDVKRVHEDVVILAGLGLLERTESGGFPTLTLAS